MVNSKRSVAVAVDAMPLRLAAAAAVCLVQGKRHFLPPPPKWLEVSLALWRRRQGTVTGALVEVLVQRAPWSQAQAMPVEARVEVMPTQLVVWAALAAILCLEVQVEAVRMAQERMAELLSMVAMVAVAVAVALAGMG
jgi:hypothetical protein